MFYFELCACIVRFLVPVYGMGLDMYPIFNSTNNEISISTLSNDTIEITNATVSTLAQNLSELLTTMNDDIKKLAPRCYMTLAIFTLALVPALILLGKIMVMCSYKKMIVQRNCYQARSAVVT